MQLQSWGCSSGSGTHSCFFHVESVPHSTLVWECALCLGVLGALACSGLWLLITGKLQGLWQSHKELGRGVRPCVHYRITRPWCPLSLCALLWKWQCPVPLLLSQCGGRAQGTMHRHNLQREDERTSSCWHCSCLKCSCDGHRVVYNWSNICMVILGAIPKPGSQALPPSSETGRVTV